MRKQMFEKTAYELATQVRAVEDRIEAALADIAELQARMVRARTITGAGMVTSHRAFEQLGVITTALISARGGIANCHVALAETQKTIPGLRAMAIGDDGNCPPATGDAPLRIVA